MSTAADCKECENTPRKNSKAECKNALGKLAMSSVLLYMLYIGVTCPCEPLYDCHLAQMYVGVALIIAILVYFNGVRLVGKSQNK